MVNRIVTAAAAAVLALSVLVPVTLAKAPTRDYLPIDGPIQFDAGDPCPFPVRIDVLVNTEYGETFRDSSGNVVRQLVGGRLVVAVTNSATGRSLTANISGPGEIIVHPDGSTTFILRGSSMPFGPGFLLLTTGTVVQEIDANGGFVSQTHVGGTEQDVCATLG